MKNDCMELHLMNSTDLCQKCHSAHTCEIKSRPISAWLAKMIGHQMIECKDCGHRWKEFFPYQPLLNLIYFVLAVEIIFLMMSYYRDMAHYLFGIFP